MMNSSGYCVEGALFCPFSQRVWRSRSVRLQLVLGMKVKAVGCAALLVVCALCAQPGLLQLSLSRDAGITGERLLDLPWTEAGVWLSYKMFGVCCGYWESREMPQPPACQCPEESPAGAGLGRFYFVCFISFLLATPPGHLQEKCPMMRMVWSRRWEIFRQPDEWISVQQSCLDRRKMGEQKWFDGIPRILLAWISTNLTFPQL